jgi:(1->4)-alpha-D-glucan 1-alpha-D-glucosylmutase
VLAPFLGKPYADCLRDGEITLTYSAEGFVVQYFDLKFPLRIESYPDVLGHRTTELADAIGGDRAAFTSFSDLLDELAAVAAETGPPQPLDRFPAIKQALWDLYRRHPAVARFVDDNLGRFNAAASQARPFELLDRLLSRQRFWLSHWKTAAGKINYRRFFDINHLIALCQETEAAFDQTHGLATRLVGSGEVNGIRIDHVDGLADPAAYLERLRTQLGEVPILVEKILGSEEKLPDAWPVQGTTGYEFSALLSAVFVDRRNEQRFSRIYDEFCRPEASFEKIAVAGKRRVLEQQLAGDLDNLLTRLKRAIGEKASAGPDAADCLKSALTEMLCRFPVYRTYIDRTGATESDRSYVRQAFDACLPQLSALRDELELICRTLLGPSEDGGAGPASASMGFITRFQQMSATLMAKGLEDTALYVYNRFVALNDVGADPRRFGCSLNSFHATIHQRRACHPHGMVSTATHDSKRGEDVRARLSVLSEMPGEWRRQVQHWHRLNQGVRDDTGHAAPDKNEEYLLYQTLIGAWPFDDREKDSFARRIQDYMVKAAREAKVHTNWMDPRGDYESGLVEFVTGILDPSPTNGFLEAFLPFCRKIAFWGIFNTLSQVLLKVTIPGFPDIYQGSELPDLTLVDPDNRRPVDFEKRQRCLRDIREGVQAAPLGFVEELLHHVHDGRLKMFTLATGLEARRRFAALFHDGDYIPLETAGEHRRRVIAFARAWRNQWSVTAVPRFLSGLAGDNRLPVGPEIWGDTEVVLPRDAPARWKNCFSHQMVVGKGFFKMGDAFRHYPCALLVSEEAK